MPVQNPFFHRGPIRDPVYFFGREDETRQILSLLGNGQSISLVGQRRIGKTSLLFHLAEPDIFTPYGLKTNEHLFVYIDCGGLSHLDQPGLYRLFLEEIDEALADRQQTTRLDILSASQPVTYRQFERSLRGLIRQGWKPIILLDEFERLSHNPQLDPDFFSGLRALAAKYPIAYVTASKSPLLALTYADASTLSSPFFNIFATTRLGLFSETEARDLLTGLSTPARGPFIPATLDFILDLAGLHPLFLQIAAFHAFELQQATSAPLAAEDFPELQDRFLTSVQEHFSYYWLNLSDEEQHVLATLPMAQTGRPDMTRRLAEACLIRKQDGGVYAQWQRRAARYSAGRPLGRGGFARVGGVGGQTVSGRVRRAVQRPGAYRQIAGLCRCGAVAPTRRRVPAHPQPLRPRHAAGARFAHLLWPG